MTERVLAIVSDAYGGRGGIAKFNRDLLDVVAARPDSTVRVLPRRLRDDPEGVPKNLDFVTGAANATPMFLLHLLRLCLFGRRPAVILCGHINLVPVCLLLKWRFRAPVVLFLHGIEAWTPSGGARRKRLEGIDMVVAVSAVTRDRFARWAGDYRCFLLPNCVDLSFFAPGTPSPALLARHGLDGKRIMISVARLDRSERDKGLFTLIDLVPALCRAIPDFRYVVVGDGDDRAAMAARAAALGVASAVVFTGYVSEEDKRDLYRAARVFAMPSRKEGFGIVFLEAAACGCAVVAGNADGSVEALAGGRLGRLVDPDDPVAIEAAIRDGFAGRIACDRGRLETVSKSVFVERVNALLDDLPAGR